jgi:hypothetical protein
VKYNCSVFGAPVALASRCAGVTRVSDDERYSTAVVSPATEWNGRNVDEVLPPADSHQAWELLPTQTEDLKNMGAVDVRAVVRRGMWFPSSSPEQQVKEALAEITERGRYWPSP